MKCATHYNAFESKLFHPSNKHGHVALMLHLQPVTALVLASQLGLGANASLKTGPAPSAVIGVPLMRS